MHCITFSTLQQMEITILYNKILENSRSSPSGLSPLTGPNWKLGFRFTTDKPLSVTFKHRAKGSELEEKCFFTSVSFCHFHISSRVCVTMPGKPVLAGVSANSAFAEVDESDSKAGDDDFVCARPQLLFLISLLVTLQLERVPEELFEMPQKLDGVRRQWPQHALGHVLGGHGHEQSSEALERRGHTAPSEDLFQQQKSRLPADLLGHRRFSRPGRVRHCICTPKHTGRGLCH
ncbi:hypothetical protein C0J52_00636 [Blattella germanica]|nr:hypothetical protein C0J52_00636 [Blattella germanica]